MPEPEPPTHLLQRGVASCSITGGAGLIGANDRSADLDGLKAPTVAFTTPHALDQLPRDVCPIPQEPCRTTCAVVEDSARLADDLCASLRINFDVSCARSEFLRRKFRVY